MMMQIKWLQRQMKEINLFPEPSTSIEMQQRKRENRLIQNNVTGDVNMTRLNIKTLIAFVEITIPKKAHCLDRNSSLCLL
jgi:hypothetical protein